ncbi:MAG: hypothetical protein IPL37_03025 [Austwickia sp.]|nr:hypothetical protein [Austwickia sp.]
MVGLTLYGVSMAMLIRSTLGLDPWDVLHVGLAGHLGWSIGVTTIAVGAFVLLGWIPLRQWPGLGTVANTIWIGVATDAALAVIPVTDQLPVRWALLLTGIVGNGLASALYIGSQLGPGPRDGLMTGLHHRTGVSIRVVRTALELTVLGIGWWLGGTVGVGTVMYAVGIGPLLHAFLPRCIVALEAPGTTEGGTTEGGTTEGGLNPATSPTPPRE